MNCKARSTSLCVVRTCFLLPLLLGSAALASAEEKTWTGAESKSWHLEDNWAGGLPGIDDVVRIPSVANMPEIGGTNTMEIGVAICAGMVLEDGASLKVVDSGSTDYPNALYIIGDGDLDKDGVPDIQERDECIAVGSFDADGDGIPNIAEIDSDNDEIPDSCEFQYFIQTNDFRLHPYYPAPPDQDTDGDGYSDLRECERGGDPTDPEVVPLPAFGTFGLWSLGALLAGLAAWGLRRAGRRARRVLLVLLLTAISAFSLYWEAEPLWATSSTVDFSGGQTVEGVGASATSGTTLELAGGTDRAWNGQSTYVVRPLTITASGGTVFLGGMRATVRLGVLGQGTLQFSSAHTTWNPSPISGEILSGSVEKIVFLGERLFLEATPDSGWRHHGWVENVELLRLPPSNPPSYQVSADGLQVTALFGPPGPDLAGEVSTGPTLPLFAGDIVTVGLRVVNIGLDHAIGPGWDDGLYLSRDTLFDPGDLELDVNPHSGTVNSGGNYTTSFVATTPDVAPGRYYLLAVADAGLDATDANRSNNAVTVSISVLDVNLSN